MIIVNEEIYEINSGIDVSTALHNALIKLMGVDGLVSEWNVFTMPVIITNINSKDGLVDIFQSLIDNINEVYIYEEDIKATFDDSDYNAVAEALGKIFKYIFIYINLFFQKLLKHKKVKIILN